MAAGVDPHGPHRERRRDQILAAKPGGGARPRSLPRGRRGGARLAREPRHDPHPRLGEPRAGAGAAGLVHRGPRSQGRALRPRGAARARAPRPVRRDRAAVLPEDDRAEGAPRPRPARRAARPRAGAHPRRAARARARGGAAGTSRPPRARSATAAAGCTSTICRTGRGKTIAAPYTVRPRPGAPVSTPLRWSEVGARLDPSRFTIRNVPARARRLRADPLHPVLTRPPDLLAALERLRSRAPRAAGAGPPPDRVGAPVTGQNQRFSCAVDGHHAPSAEGPRPPAAGFPRGSAAERRIPAASVHVS